MNISTKNPAILAMVAIGAFWLLTQNKARASGVTPTAKAPPVASNFLRTINGKLPTRSTADGKAPIAAYINSGLSLLQALPRLAQSYGGNQGISVFSPDYVPSYTPDNAGEAAAQTYYQEHADAFIAPMPDYAAINATPWAQAALNDPSEY